jgi:cell division protein FtsL
MKQASTHLAYLNAKVDLQQKEIIRLKARIIELSPKTRIPKQLGLDILRMVTDRVRGD